MKHRAVVKKSAFGCAVLVAALLWAMAAVAAPYDFEFTATLYAAEDTLWAPR